MASDSKILLASETDEAPQRQSIAEMLRHLHRRLMRHAIVLLFCAGVFVLFVIESMLPLWLAALGFAIVAASALVYTGAPAAIDPRRWRAERRYAMRRDAADLIPNPILLVGMDGKIRLGNKAARSLFEREDLRGLPLSAIVRDPTVFNAFSESLKDGTARQVEWHILVPVERYFYISIEAALAPRRGMKPFLLVSFEEKTDIRLADQMRSDFITHASHELKTPLATLNGYLEIIKELKEEDKETRNKFLTTIEAQAARMTQLVEDLLSLSRIEQREHKMPQETINLAAAIRDAVEINLPIAEQNDIEIKTDSLPENISIQGDHRELTQMISNLIHNALTHGSLKNSSSAGNISVSVSVSEEQLDRQPAWGIHIRDFGPGIANHHIPRLTERFYRVNPEESRKLGGTGLGLAIIKHILARHRGELKISSQEGKGATFTALIPKK